MTENMKIGHNQLPIGKCNKISSGYTTRGRPIKLWIANIKVTLNKHGYGTTEVSEQDVWPWIES